MNKAFDIFLCHNSQDKPAVRKLAEALRARGLKVWLDEWELVPGQPWQEGLEEVIETTQSSAVLVGKDGFGPWQDAEMRGCLEEFVARKQPVIPVLLPGAPAEPKLPLFLRQFTWVDLRSGLTEEGLDRLQWGATGKRTDRSQPPSTAAREATGAAAKAQPVSASEWKKATSRAGVFAGVLGVLVGGIIIFYLLGLPRKQTCVPGEERTEDGIAYVRICSGAFTMGSDDPQAYSAEKPPHKVRLSEFWIGKTEITNEQYRRFRPDHQGEARLPATNVSWIDAQAACEHFGGSLPTEAQWEYAARAGSRAAWAFGDDEKRLGEHAWYGGNSGKTPHPVGTKKPNAWGLHDMHGNVWEWVADWYGRYPSAVQTDPTGPTGNFPVLRGGSFLGTPELLRSSFRLWFEPESRSRRFGFRCVRVRSPRFSSSLP